MFWFLRSYTHSATVGSALGMIGLVLVYNGTIDVPDIDQAGQNLIISTCLVGGLASVALSFLALTRRIVSSGRLEAAMAFGLFAAAATNCITGTVWPDSLWIVCGYTMAIAFAAGVTLRTPYVFGGTLGLLVVAWLIAVEANPDEIAFRGDANTLILVGVLISIASFVSLRLERDSQARLTRQLRKQLDHDALTGVLNRTGLLVGLDELRRTSNGADPIWCAYVDVDFFKTINDRKGHDYGDEVLREIAAGLTEACGEEALVSRWGGDEFVVVANGDSPSEETIETKVGLSLARRNLRARVTAGVTSSRCHQIAEPSRLIERADLRMYQRRDAARAGSSGQLMAVRQDGQS